jgi:hypothetical protein
MPLIPPVIVSMRLDLIRGYEMSRTALRLWPSVSSSSADGGRSNYVLLRGVLAVGADPHHTRTSWPSTSSSVLPSPDGNHRPVR